VVRRRILTYGEEEDTYKRKGRLDAA